MATIKSYTDISQSKTLNKILPLESADMQYISFRHRDDTVEWVSQLGTPSKYDFPCWSLAALLDVLPYCPDLSKHTDGKWYITTYPNDVHTCLMAYDNPVDACVAMIIKLKEKNLL